jgi:hypothetical protein
MLDKDLLHTDTLGVGNYVWQILYITCLKQRQFGLESFYQFPGLEVKLTSIFLQGKNSG